MTPKDYRVTFTIDETAEFEESNGESRPLTEKEYKGNEYRACPNGHRYTNNDRIENGRAWCGTCGAEYADVPYTNYLQYQGNPERHVFIGCTIEKQCECCDSWINAESLWSIDFMDDSPEYLKVNLDKPYTPAQAIALPGYLADVARELLTTAGWTDHK